MTSRIFASRRGHAVAVHSAVAALAALPPALLLGGCAPTPGLGAAWNGYVAAEAAFESCKAQPHRLRPNCDPEHAAYEAARERYRAATSSEPAARP